MNDFFQKSKIKLAKELSDLVIYCKSVHFSGFEHARDNQAFYEMSSFKESKAVNLAETSGWNLTGFSAKLYWYCIANTFVSCCGCNTDTHSLSWCFTSTYLLWLCLINKPDRRGCTLCGKSCHGCFVCPLFVSMPWRIVLSNENILLVLDDANCLLFSLTATAYIHHNMDKLSRIYPAGSRTDSSNYNPVPLWNAGCQIGISHSRAY